MSHNMKSLVFSFTKDRINFSQTHTRTTTQQLQSAPQYSYSYSLLFIRLADATTSHFARHGFLDSLGTFVGLVHLGPLAKGGSLQITTVKHVGGRLSNGPFNSSKVTTVHGNDSLTLGGLRRGLAGRLDNEFCLVIVGADNIDRLTVGEPRVLELVQRLEVALFGRKGNGS